MCFLNAFVFSNTELHETFHGMGLSQSLGLWQSTSFMKHGQCVCVSLCPQAFIRACMYVHGCNSCSSVVCHRSLPQFTVLGRKDSPP